MIKKCIPSFITLLNLLSGCLSVVSAFEGNTAAAALFILVAAVFDFFDGFAARLLHAQSELGKQLDSLADMVSFGLAPSVILFVMMQQSQYMPDITFFGYKPLPYLAFLITLFSALRLARFNIDTRQTYGFIGLPTPANALLIASLPLILWQFAETDGAVAHMSRMLFSNFYVLAGLSIVMSYLLIAELKLMAFKFKSRSFKGNEVRYGFAVFAVSLFAVFNFAAIPIIIIFYIFLSLISNLLTSTKQQQP